MSPENWTHIFKSRKTEEPRKEHLAKKNSEKSPKACSDHVWTLLETFLGFFGILNFFLKICRDSTPHGTLNNFFCRKKMPQNTFGHLGTILDNFRTLNFFSIFPWNFSKSLPHNLSPENQTHFLKSWKLISYF